MTTTLLESKKNEAGRLRACLVTEHEWLADIQGYLTDTNLLVGFRRRLLDLDKDRDCSLYIVDTAVRDMDAWPAPLLAVPDAWSKDWLFLVSGLSDAARLQPLPRNARFLDRRRLSAEKIASLIKKQLDPESKKKFARVRYLEDIRAFLAWMENGKTYALSVSDLPEADSSKVLNWSLSRDRSYVKVMQESGNAFEVPWDDVLYHCEPQYEFYKGKRSEDAEAGASQIGERIRQIRERKGYSVQALADRVGMRRPNVSRLEHGHHQPSLETLERIAEALDVPVADMVAKRAREG